jgi:hypothetical protein
MSNLIEAFKRISEYRKARGKIHPLWVLLILIVMGMLAGYGDYRPLQLNVCHKAGGYSVTQFGEILAPTVSTTGFSLFSQADGQPLCGSILRTITINLLRMHGFQSLKSSRRLPAKHVDKTFLPPRSCLKG